MLPLKYLSLLLLATMASFAQSEAVNVAVASNFALPMKALVAEFERSSDHQVKLSFASSGKFYAQIVNGAPFSVFFSADQAKPAELEQYGFSVVGSRFTYAVGQLVLWSAKPSYMEEGKSVLVNGEYRRIALANPKLAPYGAAAAEVLENLGLTVKTQSKWVRGENIAQTYQLVSTGNADLGFVALSQISGSKFKNKGEYWLVPSELHSPIMQDAVLLKRGVHNKAALALIAFVRSKAGSKIIESYGYTIPPIKQKVD